MNGRKDANETEQLRWQGEYRFGFDLSKTAGYIMEYDHDIDGCRIWVHS